MAGKDEDDIKVNDKRRFKMDGGAGAQDSGEEPENNSEGLDDRDTSAHESVRETGGGAEEHFKIGFIDLINSLAGTTLIQLGAVADPQTNTIKKDIHAARQTIDILELLKEKTAGNLTNDESMMIDNVLFDLRMRYVLILEGKK